MSRVIVIGGGGREHALAWKLSQSAAVSEVQLVPGNAGTALAGGKLKNCTTVSATDPAALVAFCCAEPRAALVVVGPEAPLVAGLADALAAAGVRCFGPSAAAAQLEADKAFAHEFMVRHGIAAARTASFTEFAAAEQHIRTASYRALVVKAAGLAAGKGVVVATDVAGAVAAARAMLLDGSLGEAGRRIVVEELLEGPEVSCLAFTDGHTVLAMPPVQDYKRQLAGDAGPNTGGMGAYCPCPLLSTRGFHWIQREVLQRAVDGLRAEGRPFVGVLYAGIMLTSAGPRVLEFNCRFGDPETQVLLPLLTADLYQVALACVDGSLGGVASDGLFDGNHVAVAVVAASQGYPAAFAANKCITGLNTIQNTRGKIEVTDDACKLLFHAGTKLSADGASVETSGGRVLAAVAVHRSLTLAAHAAQSIFDDVTFDGLQYRADIGDHGLLVRRGMTYRAAGVDVGAGNCLVRTILPLLRDTRIAGCLDAGSGLFGAGFALREALNADASRDTALAPSCDPVLVSGMDGVGTKLAVAVAMGQHDTVGQDLVAMCVNDILCHGARPLFFLDYFASGRLHVDVTAQIVAGVARACQASGCALVGGETAELPGVYQPADYELAGCAVGVVERAAWLPRVKDQVPGDVLLALRSSGLHSNGFSLARRCAEQMPGGGLAATCPWSPQRTLGQELLTPTRLYVNSLLPLLRTGLVKAAAHITGGGLLENIPRVLARGLNAELLGEGEGEGDWLPLPPVFRWLARTGALDDDELARTFNCGIGMVLVVAAGDVENVCRELVARQEQPLTIGRLVAAEQADAKARVLLPCLTSTALVPLVQPAAALCRVAVLISGAGSNLQALLEHCARSESVCRVVLVLSNVAHVAGLTRAAQAGVPAEAIPHGDYASRQAFEAELQRRLAKARVQLVCLAGFMRVLTPGFVERWHGRLLNVHPSLLPAFPGAHAHRDVLAAGVRVSGSTVHFVAAQVDAGAILAQESVPVHRDDSEASLAERVKLVEHVIYPRALEALARNEVRLEGGKAVWSLV